LKVVLSHPSCARRAVLLGLAALACAARAPAAPQFTGVWQPIDPPLALHTVQGLEPPLLPAPRALYEQRKAMLAKGDRSFDRSSTECAPPGEPRILTEQMPFDILQTPKTLLLGFQWNRLVRQIDIDQPLEVVSPYYFGTSVGHFVGDTLQVEAEGFNDKFFLDRSGMPHSTQLRLRETFRLGPDGNTLRIRIHFEDPRTFSAPWDAELQFRRQPGARIAEDICTLRLNLVPSELRFFDPN
jgi:hypothetical protein